MSSLVLIYHGKIQQTLRVYAISNVSCLPHTICCVHTCTHVQAPPSTPKLRQPEITTPSKGTKKKVPAPKGRNETGAYYFTHRTAAVSHGTNNVDLASPATSACVCCHSDHSGRQESLWLLNMIRMSFHGRTAPTNRGHAGGRLFCVCLLFFASPFLLWWLSSVHLLEKEGLPAIPSPPRHFFCRVNSCVLL